MTYKEKILWLWRYRKALRNENLLKERLETAQERATSISQALSPISTHSAISDKMAACLERIEQYQIKLGTQILNTEAIRDEIEATLDTLPDEQRAVLYERYILGKKFEDMRDRAKRFFNPKYDYKIYLTYMGTTYWLAAELSAFKAPNDQIDQPQTWSAYFLAANPYWQSVDDFGQDIAAITPRWGFPYMDHPAYGVLVDVANFTRSVVFDYDGDVPAYPTIVLTADDAVTNAKIIKDDAYVRLIDELVKGDRVEIDTNPRHIRITKNGVNVLNKTDRGSKFTVLQMTPGTNTVRYEADYGDNNLHVVIRYNKQYLGV